MARETFSSLVLATQNLCIDDSSATFTGMSDTKTFIKKQVNNTVSFLFSMIKKYQLQPTPKTASTIANQIYYHNPPGLAKIEGATITIGSITPVLRVIESQQEWDYLHTFPVTSGLPTAIFPRRDDFGIYPTPRDVYTITLTGNYQPVNMSADDYVTGTITTTQNSRTITGSSTTFTSKMVGRWFVLTDSYGIPDGNWYRISAYTSATSLTLESYFEDPSTTGSNYLIGESPELPEELQEFIPYRAASVYFSTRRKDTAQAAALMNYFNYGDWEVSMRYQPREKGGVLNWVKEMRQRGRNNSQLVDMGPVVPQNVFSPWGVTLSAPL